MKCRYAQGSVPGMWGSRASVSVSSDAQAEGDFHVVSLVFPFTLSYATPTSNM